MSVASLIERIDILTRQREIYREGWLLRGRKMNGTGEYADVGPWTPPEEHKVLTDRIERLELAVERIYRDRRESDKVLGECLSVRPELFDPAEERARFR